MVRYLINLQNYILMYQLDFFVSDYNECHTTMSPTVECIGSLQDQGSEKISRMKVKASQTDLGLTSDTVSELPISETHENERNAVLSTAKPQCRNNTLTRTDFKSCLIAIILTFTLAAQEVKGQWRCRQPAETEFIRWRSDPGNLTVEWRLDQACSGVLACYGFNKDRGGLALTVQLCPAEMQAGDALFLKAPPEGSPYIRTAVNVSESEWYTCPRKPYAEDQILENQSGLLQVPLRFLRPGVLYLAQHPDGAFSNCNFGLRVKILIKEMKCRASPGAELCSGRGVCGSTFLQEVYRCYCYTDYRGSYCSEYDACAQSPCKNDARCIDGLEGLNASNFLCICRQGFTGKYIFNP